MTQVVGSVKVGKLPVVKIRFGSSGEHREFTSLPRSMFIDPVSFGMVPAILSDGDYNHLISPPDIQAKTAVYHSRSVLDNYERPQAGGLRSR
jgi:hypothetical protein